MTRARYEDRVRELTDGHSGLSSVIEPMLVVRRVVRQQYVVLQKRMIMLARKDDPCRLLMSAPGVGPLVALTYRAAVDEPARFRQSRSVGAHFGLAPRTHQSGEVDWRGHITKSGDETIRSALFEAALVILPPGSKSTALRTWGLKLAKRRGTAKAMVGVARRLSVILHRMWVDGTTFRMSVEAA